MRDGAFKALVSALLFTVIGFAAGLAAGIWRERHRPLPPPPAGFMAEFGVAGAVASGAPVPQDRGELVASIERIRPQIEDYRQRLMAIDDEFDRDLEGILSPEQRAHYEERQRKRAADKAAEARPSDPAVAARPLTDEQVSRYLQAPFRGLVSTVILQLRLDGLVRDLKLDESQRGKARDLLRVRREKFIELVDSVPPPSVLLSRLAPVAQRIDPVRAASPAPAPAAAP